MNLITDRRIFIIDDDPFWTRSLSQILKDCGCTNIYTYASGEACVENLHLNPGIIFLDYQMDDMNGLEVLEQVKAYYPGIGVVFCTAYEDLGIAVDAIKKGSFEYLLKTNAGKKEVAAILKAVHEKLVTGEKIY